MKKAKKIKRCLECRTEIPYRNDVRFCASCEERLNKFLEDNTLMRRLDAVSG